MVVGSELSQRVLALARQLVADIAVVTLDTIDGEFFWRVCQAQTAALFDAYVTPYPPLPTTGEAFSRSFRALMDVQSAHGQAWNTITGEHPDLVLMVPDPVVSHFLAGERVPMRPATVTHALGTHQFPGEEVLLVQVRSGEWVGRDVERALTRQLLRDPLLARGAFQADHVAASTSWSGDAIAVRIAFEPHGDLTHTQQEWVFWGPGEYPYVEVMVPMPLPGPGVIARQYDAFVREDHAWHERLPGGIAIGQHKLVAIRTWAVGLLMVAGQRYHDAMREVCTDGRLDEVSQSRFGADRRRLLRRVPEARPFLWVMR